MTIENNTFPQDGDPDDADRFAQLIGSDVVTDTIRTGLTLDPDFATSELTVNGGVCHVSAESAIGASDGREIRSLGYVLQVETQTISLPTSGVHHVVIEANLSTIDGATVGLYEDGVGIPSEALTIGVIDVDAQTVERRNVNPSADFAGIDVDSVGLPSGSKLGEDNGDMVIRDSSNNIVMRYDESTSGWQLDTLTVSGKTSTQTLEATDSFIDPSGFPHTDKIVDESDLVEQKERVDKLRLDFVLDGLGFADSFSETFIDTTNVAEMSGVSITTGTDGFVELTDFINISETVLDGQSYTYDLLERASVASLDVSITGVNNTASESISGTLSSGVSKTTEVVSDKPPINDEITLSAPYAERSPSTSGSASESGSETISASGSYSISDATVDLQGVTPPQWDDIGSTDYATGLSNSSYTHQISTSSPGVVESVDVKLVMNGSGYTDVTFDIEGDQIGWGDFYDEQYQDTTTKIFNIDANDKSVPANYNFTTNINRTANIDFMGVRINYKTDTSVTVNGASLNPTGSTTVPLSEGSNTINFGDIDGTLDYTISWDEVDGVGDISGTIGSSMISHSGLLTESVTKSVDLSDGSNTIDLTYDGQSDALDYNLSWSEITQTQDPTVTINGNSYTYDGTLTDGSTTNLPFSASDIVTGENNISIGMTDPTDGPVRKIGVDIVAVTNVGVVKLGTFNTDYVIEELVSSNTIEGGDSTDVNHVIEDANGNVQIVDDTNIGDFVEPPFTGQNATVMLEIENYGVQLKEMSLFTNDTVGV